MKLLLLVVMLAISPVARADGLDQTAKQIAEMWNQNKEFGQSGQAKLEQAILRACKGGGNATTIKISDDLEVRCNDPSYGLSTAALVGSGYPPEHFPRIKIDAQKHIEGIQTIKGLASAQDCLGVRNVLAESKDLTLCSANKPGDSLEGQIRKSLKSYYCIQYWPDPVFEQFRKSSAPKKAVKISEPIATH